ncbi:helix-turn-helix domain-containing protein [Actinosynnema sp. NPDC050436]|uniref:PucR family transcriptional regulator n=1 Tax=Actinosynnema sp. NPDC050436 TaxID=3155659 RepID=UPI0033CF595F
MGRQLSVERVVDEVGSTLLRVAAHPGHLDTAVTGVAIHDPGDEHPTAPGEAVLGVGVTDPDHVCRLLHELGAADAAALLVRAPAADGARVREASAATGVAVLEVSRDATWTQVVGLVRAALEEPAAGLAPDESRDDLFDVANATAALLGLDITIENRSSRVLAFSAGQEDVDEGRRRTVLDLGVPEYYVRLLTERGVFRRLYRARRPVYVESLEPGTRPRAAIALRHNENVIGFLWAIVNAPLTGPAEQAFVDASLVVAAHLSRHLAGPAPGARLRDELVAAVLDDPRRSADALRRLGLDGRPLCVLALDTRDGGEERRPADARRLGDALALHLAGVHRSGAAGVVRNVVYALVPVPSEEDGQAHVARVAAAFLGKFGDRARARAGVGSVAPTAELIGRSRQDADDVLRALRDGREERVATCAALRVDLMVLRLADQARADLAACGPVARLLAYDAKHRTDLVGTLDAYLDSFGDVGTAATRLHVHPNTFRYRLARLCDVGGLDLSDPDARLGAILDLRLHGMVEV